MDWLRVTVVVPDQWVEAAVAQCLELGCGTWVEDTQVHCYLPVDSSDMDRLQLWKADMAAAGVEGICLRAEVVSDSQWKDAYKRFFRPLPVGNRFLVVPPWIDCIHTDRQIICVDPGQAFGTGHHATTAMVIEELERVIVGGERVLDGGTGSGIVAVVAVLLGARTVTAVDSDPIAVQCALDNVSAYVDQIDVIAADITAFDHGRYDVVVTNLTTDLLLSIVELISDRVRPQGKWILSGISSQRSSEIEQVLEKNCWQVTSVERRDGWAMVSAVYGRQ